MIPNEVIDRVLDKNDIVEVISAYVPLRKAGQNFRGLCPFHEEKTPSFMVSPSKQIYHCFGCSAGGNAIGFLMKHEDMTFIEALKLLADKVNIALPRYSAGEREKNTLAEKLYNVNEVACGLYQENLKKDSGRAAREYFSQRLLSEDSIKHFRLGFSQDSWQGLLNQCRGKGIEQDLLEKAGLILRKDNRETGYDRFRNRIMFPIFDQRKRILGFGARALDESLPKYINSPETYIYKKSDNLYGLNFSRTYIKNQNYAIIVEGYFDLILPFQNGVRNIVATLGTALTPGQIGALKRLTKNIIMIYDSDKAGETATLRGLDLLIEEGMTVRIAILPKGADPDSFARKEGSAGFAKLLKSSKDLFDYKLGTLTAKFRKDEPRGKARIVEGMLPTLARIKNAVLKSGYLKKMSEEISVNEESIRAELKKVVQGGDRFFYRAQENAETKKEPSGNFAEMTLLALVLDDEAFIDKVDEDIGLASFKSSVVGGILEKMADFRKNGKKITPSHLIGYFENEKIGEIISEAMNLVQTIKDKRKVFEDCSRHIRRNNLKAALNNIQFKIKEAESASDSDRVVKLVAEYSELIKGLT